MTSNDSTVDVLLESKEYLAFSNYASMYTSLLNEATENDNNVLTNSSTNQNLTENAKQEMMDNKLKRMQVTLPMSCCKKKLCHPLMNETLINQKRAYKHTHIDMCVISFG